MRDVHLDERLRPGEGEELVFDATPTLAGKVTHYCPGCHHGIAHRLVSEALDGLGAAEPGILAASVG